MTSVKVSLILGIHLSAYKPCEGPPASKPPGLKTSAASLGTELTEKSLPLSIQKQADKLPEKQAPVADEVEAGSLFAAEKQLILRTLEETAGNKSEAARRLGITRKTLLNKLNKYEVE